MIRYLAAIAACAVLFVVPPVEASSSSATQASRSATALINIKTADVATLAREIKALASPRRKRSSSIGRKTVRSALSMSSRSSRESAPRPSKTTAHGSRSDRAGPRQKHLLPKKPSWTEFGKACPRREVTFCPVEGRLV